MAYLMAIMPSDTECATLHEVGPGKVERLSVTEPHGGYMPVWLALLQLASGLQRARSGDKFGGFAQMFGAGQSFFNSVDSFNEFPTYSYHSFGESDSGVRRNFM